MVFFECPGAQKFRKPEPEFVKCPFCKGEVEIWTDEVKATCPGCGESVMKQAGASCLDWCRYAKECVGDKVYSQYMQNSSCTIKERLIEELEGYFGGDKKRIAHARKVLNFAEELLTKEKGDWHIVIPASILHDIGIKEAEKKFNSSAGHYQEKEGPPVAREILLKLGLKIGDINEICEIIAHHHSPGKIETQNFRILYDADWLVNLKDEVDTKDKQKLEKIIDKVFLTDTGKKLAKEIYIK